MRMKMIAVDVVDLQLSLEDGRLGAHEPSMNPQLLRAGATPCNSNDTVAPDGANWPSTDF